MEEVDIRVLSFGLKGGVWAENSCRIPSPDARNRGCLTLLDVISSYILVAPRVLGGFFQQINTRCDWKNDILSKSTDNGISLASSMDLLEDRSVVYNLGGKLVV